MNNKKLNLLCPDERTGYLNYGRGQEVTYLDIPVHINAKALSDDVENGATQFSELNEFVKKKPSQFVIIDAKNREEGLMAVTYLAGVYNEIDKINYKDDFVPDGFAENSYNALSSAGFVLDENPEETAGCERWVEDPWRMPIIDFFDIYNDYGIDFQPFGGGDVLFGSAGMNFGENPYWHSVRNEPICIVCENGLYVDVETAVKKINRLLSNRHVYLLHINDRFEYEAFMEDMWEDENEEYSVDQELFTELMLEYTATIVKVDTTKEERENYYSLLFENWIRQFGKKLDEHFPVDKIASKIVKTRNSSKSRMMEKVIKYVLKDESIGEVLKESDFEMLDKFKRLGLFEEKSKGENSTQQLENNIIGLQSVKEDVKSIVNIMKYNRYREKKGLPKSEFHNVHMLLGAPGTAKTTIAKLMGNMMVEEKLLKGNRFTSITGAQLKAEFVGHTAPKVHALFEDNDIIFIDEAYSVASGYKGEIDSFGQEAIAQLIVELENHANNRLVIFAGYGGNDVSDKDNKMLDFLESNPGIRSRINSTIVFNSYSADEMVEIFYKHASLKKYKVDKTAKELLKTYFEGRIKMSDFGNGREARSLLENSVRMAAVRVMSIPEENMTRKMLSEIKKRDIQQAILKTKEGILAQGTTRKTVQSGFAV